MTRDTMDEALEFLADRGPIFGGYLANHGPMAAEALVRLGRADAVLPYLEWYSGRLEELPRSDGSVDESNWRKMLGRRDQFAGWQRFFEAELAGRPWRDALATWAGRLAPGLWAELMHGLIRTGHAARSLEQRETLLRLRELAQGLALWASWYEALPDPPVSAGSLAPREAFAKLPLLPREQRGLRGPMDNGATIPGMEAAVGLLDVVEPMAALSEMTELYAGLYAANAGLPGSAPILLVHAVTGPSAVRLIAPYVSEETQRRLVRYAWQSAARINASWNFAGEPAEVEASHDAGTEKSRQRRGSRRDRSTGRDLDREDLIEQAVASQDEHAIKLVEACLREYELNSQPVYLTAAHDVVGRLRA